MLQEQLLQQGIRPKRYTSGDQKTLCPKCSHTRKDRKDPCLSLTIDGESAVWIAIIAVGLALFGTKADQQEEPGRHPRGRAARQEPRRMRRSSGLPSVASVPTRFGAIESGLSGDFSRSSRPKPTASLSRTSATASW